MIPKDFTALSPYPHLSETLTVVLKAVYAHFRRTADGIEGQDLRYQLSIDRASQKQLVDLELLRIDGHKDRYLPTALGLLHVAEAYEDLMALEALIAFIHERYRPSAPKIPEADLLAELRIDREQLRRLAVLASRLDLDLGMSVDREGVTLELTERVARRQGLPAALRAAYREVYNGAGDRAALTARYVGAQDALGLRLTRLHIAGFRALRGAEISFQPGVNLLVGPNAAGKSTILDAIGFIAVAAQHGLEVALQAEGGVERLLTRGGDRVLTVEVDFTFEPAAGVSRRGSYRFVVDFAQGDPVVEAESLGVEDSEGRLQPVFRKTRALIELNLAGGREERFAPVGALALPQLEARIPLVPHIRAGLSGAVLIDRDPVIVDDLSGFATARRWTRRQLAAPLAHLVAAVAADRARTRRLAEILRELVPLVEDVVAEPIPGGLPELRIKERAQEGTAHIDEISGGTRQMLLLAAIYVLPHPPRALLIEEPEAALHPGGLPALRDLLRSIARKSLIVCTSHSPALVALLDAETEVLALHRDRDRGVRVTSLASALQSQAWLKGFGGGAEAFVRTGAERSK